MNEEVTITTVKDLKSAELPGMPKLDPVGVAAQRFKNLVEQEEELKENKKQAETQLLQALFDSGRTSISIGNYKFEIKHTDEKDGIKVSKPK